MSLSITTSLIIDAAKRRDWKAIMLQESSDFYQLIDNNNRPYYLRNITSFKGSGVNGFVTKHKDVMYRLVETAGLGTLPPSAVVQDLSQAEAFLQQHKQVVVKPSDQSHGDGVTVNIKTLSELEAALAMAQKLSPTVLIQKQIVGDDYRLVFIGGKFMAAAIREPATVIGDGVHTIEELIAIENSMADRGEGYEKSKTFIDLTSAQTFLGEGTAKIPPAAAKVQVIGVANIGKGGVAIDVTDSIDPKLVAEAKALVEHFSIGLAGIDYLVDADGIAYFIEINTSPSLGLHAYPAEGKPRDLAETFLDWLSA